MTNTKITILVVDDEPLIRINAVDLIISAGFLAVEAKNADGAIQILEKRSDVLLVFTDVNMPGTMDGIKLCHYIRDRWPLVELIAVSGNADVAENQFPVGAMFFSKPYQDSTIVGAVTQLLAACEKSEPDWIYSVCGKAARGMLPVHP